MSHNFTVFKSREKLNEHWGFFLKRILIYKITLLKYCLLIAGITTALYMLFFILSSMDNYIALKGIFMFLLIICWLALIIFAITIFIGKYKNKLFTKIYLNSMAPEQLHYQVEINETSVKINNGTIIKEYGWNEFVSYGINNNTVYVLNKAKPIESLYWSHDEMGIENYIFLVDILKQKSLNKAF